MKHFILPFAGLIFFCLSCTESEDQSNLVKPSYTELRTVADDSCGTEGLIQKILTTCDITRYYYVQLPASFDPTVSYPLLLAFHGKGSGKKNKACAWKERIGDWIDENKFIAVYGRAYEDKHWYVDDACLSPVDEVCYVQQVINEMSSTYHIKNNRIYAMGTSNGAGLCYTLVKNIDDFAAIATFAAYKWEDYDLDSVGTVPLMQVHGTEDGTIPYYSGEAFCLNFDSAFMACQVWAEHNNCTLSMDASSYTIGGSTINIAAWCSKKLRPLCKKCKNEVIHYKLNGIGHTIYDEISLDPAYKDYINDELFSFFGRNKL